MEKYNGVEKREDYCPVHNIKCGEIKDLQLDAKKRVPTWVFVIFVSLFGSILGYLNFDTLYKSTSIQLLLKEHIEKSNIILLDMQVGIRATQHGLNEVSINQKKVMKKLDLEFDEIPHY